MLTLDVKCTLIAGWKDGEGRAKTADAGLRGTKGRTVTKKTDEHASKGSCINQLYTEQEQHHAPWVLPLCLFGDTVIHPAKQ